MKRVASKIQRFCEQKELSKCILENLEKELEATKACVESDPTQTESSNRQHQTAVERSKQAALLSCQVSEGGLSWGGQNSNMDPNCDLPGPPQWKPALPTWEDLEPQANFMDMSAQQDDIHNSPKPTIK